MSELIELAERVKEEFTKGIDQPSPNMSTREISGCITRPIESGDRIDQKITTFKAKIYTVETTPSQNVATVEATLSKPNMVKSFSDKMLEIESRILEKMEEMKALILKFTSAYDK